MSKIKIGDRVRVYAEEGKFVAVVINVHGDEFIIIKDNSGIARAFYYKQCRKLKPRKPNLDNTEVFKAYLGACMGSITGSYIGRLKEKDKEIASAQYTKLILERFEQVEKQVDSLHEQTGELLDGHESNSEAIDECVNEIETLKDVSTGLERAISCLINDYKQDLDSYERKTCIQQFQIDLLTKMYESLGNLIREDSVCNRWAFDRLKADMSSHKFNV